MNTHELNEDLLTRYVLGELTDEETRAVKEALIANPEARKTVAELEQTVGMLKDAFADEPLQGLDPAVKSWIEDEAQQQQDGRKRVPWGRRVATLVGPLAIAASAVLAVGLYFAVGEPGTITAFVSAFRDGQMADGRLNVAKVSAYQEKERVPAASNARKIDETYIAALKASHDQAAIESSLRTEVEFPASAGSPDPAAGSTDLSSVASAKEKGLQPPPPVAEPLRYSEAQTAAGSEVPSSPRTEADVAAAADPAAGPAPGLQLKSAAPLGDLSVEGVAGSETPPQQSAPAPPKPEPKAESKPAARSIESSQSMPSMEDRRRLEALGYMDSMDSMDSMDGMDDATSDLTFRSGFATFWAGDGMSYTSGEQYNPIVENPFKPVANEPLSTFSIDVDTGAYSNMRRYIEAGSLPPADAVRIEELINYFEYGYPKQTYEAGADPFSAAVSVAACPWTPGHKLVRVGIQGVSMPEGQRPLSNLVFLIDVSGSMQDPDKLPLVKQGIQMLVNQLGENDKVSIVVYAGSAGLVLPPTNGSNRAAILSAIENLRAGGSTAGGEGIQLAYRLARENFIKGGVNRVILATDGDFNVGVSDEAGLIRLIEEQAKSKVFLTVLGFGSGNLQDGKMEQLSNKGNGMYAYIDSLREAKKVFVEQAEGSLITIAKDVKIQIEFNPARVQSYRLIGYENRALSAQDFNDDTKDAGEIGAGHQVTALYEIVPVGGLPQEGVDPLKYQKNTDEHRPAPTDRDGELMTLKLRYKQPEGEVSKLLEFPIVDSTQAFEQADADFRFAASVAAFGMLLRGSQHSGAANFDSVQGWAMNALGDDSHGYRAEFLDLVRKAARLR